MSVFGYRTPSIDKIKRILCCIFEKNDLKKWDFFVMGNCVLLGTSSGHVQVHHICLKKYFSSSRQFLDKIFVKNNHHLDFMQGFISTSGVNKAFFIPKSGKIC